MNTQLTPTDLILGDGRQERTQKQAFLRAHIAAGATMLGGADSEEPTTSAKSTHPETGNSDG